MFALRSYIGDQYRKITFAKISGVEIGGTNCTFSFDTPIHTTFKYFLVAGCSITQLFT